MVSQVVAAMLVMSCLQFLRCEAVVVRVDPPHLRVSNRQTNITVSCRADTPLTGCQFSWWVHDYPRYAGPILDLSLGEESQAYPAHLNQSLLSYAYSGQGLEAGECGVKLEVQGNKLWVIACRVRTGGSWVYNWATLLAHNRHPIRHTLEPRQMVALHGGQARVMVKVEGELCLCFFILPGGRGLSFSEGPTSYSSTGRHLYQGEGTDRGECGLALANITEVDNGLVRVEIETRDSSFEFRIIPLIVAHHPTSPALTLDYSNDDVTATCLVRSSCPAANITWLVNDKVLRQDSADDSPPILGDEWRWPWNSTTLMQNLTLSTHLYDGKVLRCRVTHITLQDPLEATQTVAQPKCEPLTSLSVNITCVHQQREVDCNESVPSGTVAYLRCKAGFITRPPHPGFTMVTCMVNEMWSREIYTCEEKLYSLAINPSHVRLTEERNTVRILCSAPDVPLEGCQVMWRDEAGVDGPLLDFRQGGQLSRIPRFSFSDDLMVSNHDQQDPGKGECGLTLEVGGAKHWIVGCRVRTAKGNWKYQWMDLYASWHEELPVSVTPREAVVLPGQNISLAMTANNRSLTSCWFYPPSAPDDGLEFDLGPKSPLSTGRHLYSGAGLDRGECGLLIFNVSEADSGPVRGYVWDLGAAEYRHIVVIVARPSHRPTLKLDYLEPWLTATCTVDASRLVDVSWWLGEELVRHDMEDDTPAGDEAPWVWPWKQSNLLQTIRRELQPEDRGRMLTCRVNHPALPTPLEASQKISLPS